MTITVIIKRQDSSNEKLVMRIVTRKGGGVKQAYKPDRLIKDGEEIEEAIFDGHEVLLFER